MGEGGGAEQGAPGIGRDGSGMTVWVGRVDALRVSVAGTGRGGSRMAVGWVKLFF